MKEKILNKLPSINALRTRIYIIKDKIKECEREIPEEFWCNDCKRLLQKIESLEEKKKIIKEDLFYKAYGGTYATTSTATYKYRCSRCGRFWVNIEHLWPPLGTYLDPDKKARCNKCDGFVDVI